MLTLAENFSLDNPSSRRVLLDDNSRILVLGHRSLLRVNFNLVCSTLIQNDFEDLIVIERELELIYKAEFNKDGFSVKFMSYDFEPKHMLGQRFSAIYVPFYCLTYPTWSERFSRLLVMNQSHTVKYEPFIQFYTKGE